MADIRIKTEIADGKTATVWIFCTNDIADKMIDTLREMFTVEMMQAAISKRWDKTYIKIETEQVEKVNRIRQGMTQAWIDFSVAKPSNN